MARARAGRVLEASPDRTQPRCAHFGICGGCSWQHIDYAAQLAAKRQIVRDALERIGRVRLEHDVEIIESSPGTVFDEAATEAVSQWRFDPVVENGDPVEKRVAVRMMFNVE